MNGRSTTLLARGADEEEGEADGTVEEAEEAEATTGEGEGIMVNARMLGTTGRNCIESMA